MKQLLLMFLVSYLFSTSVCAKKISVVVGCNKPPYVISQTDTGFEVDLVRAILRDMGYEFSPIYVPFGRSARLLSMGSIDIGLTLNNSHDVSSDFLSDAYVVYQNVAVTRKDRALSIDSIEDLKGKSVAAFQTASSVLGEKYGDTLSSHPTYIEMASQDSQVAMLMLGSIDVAVMDRNIFNYFKSQDAQYADDEVVLHELFPLVAYHAAIPDQQLRAAFNETLQTFIEDGRYQALLDVYGLENLLHTMKQNRPPR